MVLWTSIHVLHVIGGCSALQLQAGKISESFELNTDLFQCLLSRIYEAVLEGG